MLIFFVDEFFGDAIFFTFLMSFIYKEFFFGQF